MTNFIFSRRDLQQSINRLGNVLDPEDLRKLVAALNRQDRERLPKMWELVVLDAFSQVAPLRHEVALPSGRKPDFELSVAHPSGEPLLIVGDVATVSDAGLDEQNPIDVLFQEGPRIARRLGLEPNHLGYNVDGDRSGRYGDARIKLQLPPKGKLLQVLNGPMKAWLKDVKLKGLKKSLYEYDEEGFKFTVKYDQSQRYHSGSFTSYDVAASLEKNPLYKALRSKRDQLDGAPRDSLRLIVVCDGDSAVLSRTALSSGNGTYSAKQITSHFLNKTSSIDAVLLCTVEDTASRSSASEYQLRFDLEVADKASSPELVAANVKALGTLLRRAADQFPKPHQMPVNAARRCQDSAVSRSHNGALCMTSDSNKISARGLLDLLAGTITSEQYLAQHRWGESGVSNVFEIMRREGRSITSAHIEAMEHPDDDWIVFEFGEPDPAASPFRAPDQPTPGSKA